MVAVNYGWDELEDNIDEEYDDAGVAIAEYTTEPQRFGNLVSQRRSDQSSFLHCDGLGSTLALTDSAGSVTETNGYTAFGETTEHTGNTVNHFQYVGKKGYFRDSDLLESQIRRRAILEAVGRWTAPEPLTDADFYATSNIFPPALLAPVDIERTIPEWRETVFGSNRYAYATNSPVLFIDPSGKKPCRSECWVEYSRGNDDLDEANYQTAVVRATLETDACSCRLRYAIGGLIGQYGPCECTGTVSVALCYKATAVLSRFPGLFLDPIFVHGGLFMRAGAQKVSCKYFKAPAPDEPIPGSYYSCCLTLGHYDCAGAPKASGRATVYSPGTYYPWVYGHDYQHIDWSVQIQGCGLIADRSVKVSPIPIRGRRDTDLLRLTNSNCVSGPFVSPHPPGRRAP